MGPRSRGGASALALVLLGLSSNATADTLSAGLRAYQSHDYVRAAPLLLIEAELGVPIAQTYLGYMYQNGFGVPLNYAVAASWLTRRPSRASRRRNSCSACFSTRDMACRRTGFRPRSGSISPRRRQAEKSGNTGRACVTRSHKN